MKANKNSNDSDQYNLAGDNWLNMQLSFWRRKNSKSFCFTYMHNNKLSFGKKKKLWNKGRKKLKGIKIWPFFRYALTLPGS